MPEEYRFKALVARSVPIGDTVNLLTVLSAEYGKKTVRCYGARKPSGRVMSAVQPFCYSEFLVTEKDGRWTLREVGLLANFYELRNDMLALSLGTYMLDLACECARENASESSLLSLTLNCLFVLSRKAASPDTVKAVFELRLLAEQGCAVVYKNCARCGGALGDGCAFSAKDGGIVCADCRDVDPDGRYLPAGGSERLALTHIELSPLKQLFSFRITDACLARLSAIAEESILYYFEHDFESLRYYKEIKESLSDT